MKHFLISIDETIPEPEDKLKTIKGVTDVELVSTGEFDFSKLSLPGPPLSEEAIEALATEMSTDTDTLKEPEAEKYLTILKSRWKKPSK